MSEAGGIEVLVADLDHPEGVAWGPDGYLYAGGEAGQIYRIDIETKDVSTVGSTGGFILGIALDAASNVYACDPGHREVAKIDHAGVVTAYSRGTADRSMVTPNYPAFTRAGRLYVSDSGVWSADDGCIFAVDPSGETRLWTTVTNAFPNGLALSPDERYLYVAESTGERISRIHIGPDGEAGTREVVVELPGTVPDGLAFDAEGGLLISCYRPDRIYRLDPAGELSILAEDPQGTLLAAPTNVCFGGDGLDVLFSANLGRWHISRIHANLVGAPLNHPDLGSEAGK